MSIGNFLAQRRAWRQGVRHCTFDPQGPGVVRIHLIPPRPRFFGTAPHIVILNGYYLLPIGYSWAILLSHFMEEVEATGGDPIDDAETEALIERTVARTRRFYRHASAEELREDLNEILDVLFAVAGGANPDAEIERLSIRSYAKHMTAPHRMDLMVSAMTDEGGAWKCNQKCRFCYAAGQSLSGTRELSGDEWKRVIDRLRRAGVPMLTFTGGEPTLREDLCELVAHAKWFVTRLNTNGVALTRALADGLCKAELDSVQITLYSADETVHNTLVGASHHADTLRGIENALAAGLDVSVNTPLCRLNADYPATLTLLHRLGVRYVTLSGLICTGGAASAHADQDLTEDELCAILGAAKEFCDTHGMELDFTSPGLIASERLEALGLRVPMCGAALSNMAVSPDGHAIPCQSWLSADATLGNLLTDPFDKIWKHRICRRLRAMTEAEALRCPFRSASGKEI
ncbi:MAG: radical SAM protein [Ruminococcaceae bacterium]|nr:radical SAM protein [Oscillospiraceae bacterium]